MKIDSALCFWLSGQTGLASFCRWWRFCRGVSSHRVPCCSARELEAWLAHLHRFGYSGSSKSVDRHMGYYLWLGPQRFHSVHDRILGQSSYPGWICYCCLVLTLEPMFYLVAITIDLIATNNSYLRHNKFECKFFRVASWNGISWKPRSWRSPYDIWNHLPVSWFGFGYILERLYGCCSRFLLPPTKTTVSVCH